MKVWVNDEYGADQHGLLDSKERNGIIMIN